MVVQYMLGDSEPAEACSNYI